MHSRHRALRLAVLPLVVSSTLLFGSACVPKPMPQPPPFRGWYDARSMSRIGGDIVTVDDIRSRDPAFTGLVVVLHAEQGSVSVHLGPKEFFDRSQVSFQPGDRLEVVGVSTKYDGAPVLWATKVKKENRELDVSDRPPPHGAGEPTKR